MNTQLTFVISQKTCFHSNTRDVPLSGSAFISVQVTKPLQSLLLNTKRVTNYNFPESSFKVKHLQDESLLRAHLVAWLSYHVRFVWSIQVARGHRAVTLRACIQRVPTSSLELPTNSNFVNKHVNRYEISYWYRRWWIWYWIVLSV